jgi:chemotaxis signal transduction protein
MTELATANIISQRARELRREFDGAFAAPVHLDTTVRVDLLGINVGAQTCALRLSEIAGLFAGKKITRVPGGGAAVCGIAGFRGAVLPVYDLQVLLGQPAAQSPRWLAIASAAPVALALEAFVGQLRVMPNEIVPQTAREEMPSFARELVRTTNFTGPILHLPSVLEAIKASGTGERSK